LQRLVAHINAIVGEEIEGVQPDLFVAPPLCKPSKSEIPSGPMHNGFAVDDE